MRVEPWLREALLWLVGGLLGLFGLIVLLNLALGLALFGPAEGMHRLAQDARRIVGAHRMGDGRLTPEAAFARLYGPELGAAPNPEEIRAHIARDLENGEPAVFDVVLARYIVERFGAIDGRTVPSGVYLAAGPIGPDPWPGPILSHYLMFARHGYLLVVPPRRAARWPPAYEATASLRKDLRAQGDADQLYAEVQPYRPGAFDFPSPGEPVHDLLLIAADPGEIARIEPRLKALGRRIDRRDLTYRLFRRNSNSALACYLKSVGLADRVGQYVRSRLLLRLRLPGIRPGAELPC